MKQEARLTPEDRRKVIINAAVEQAVDAGIMSVSFDSVAERCKIKTSPGTVRWYYRTVGDLREAAAKADASVMDEMKGMGLI